jgi:hypothetical protein
MTDNSIIVSQVVQAAQGQLQGGGRGRHSPLYEWLWTHYKQLQPELSAPRMPNWSAIAETLAGHGIADGTGKAPTAALTRSTWWKVCRDKTEGPKRRKSRGAPTRAVQVAPVSRPLSNVRDDDEAGTRRVVLQPARPKTYT